MATGSQQGSGRSGDFPRGIPQTSLTSPEREARGGLITHMLEFMPARTSDADAGEEAFLTSLGRQWAQTGYLSDRQFDALERVYVDRIPN